MGIRNFRKLLLLFVVISNCLFQITSEEETFKVGFLYSSLDSERWPEGFSAIYSAEIALKRIEAANILPKGVKIELVPEATDCDPMRARDSVLRLLNENEVKMFIGPPCRSEAQDVCGFLAHPLFRNTTYRKPFVLSSASSYAPMVENQDMIVRYGQIFEEIFLNNHWELDGTTQVSAMYYDWNQSEEEISRGLESFFIYDVKVILYAGGRDIAKLICVAESMGFFDSNFVWYVWSWVWPHALESIPEYCREDQIENLRKSDGFFVLEPNPKSLPETKIDVGITTEELFQEIQIRINDDYENNTILAPSNYDLYVYDAVWIVANSVHALMNKSGQQLFDAFFEVTETVSFSGLSGKIEFGEGPHTLWPQFALKQLKGFETEITLAEGSIDALDFIENISWVGGEQPLDYTYNIKYTMVYKMLYIDWYTAVALDTVGAIFVLISLFCIFVNNFYRKKKMIKITSPMINNFILLGVILVLSGVFFGSYLAFGENKDVFLIICYAKTLFFATGFTLGFGGLFCKTWRVYRALTNKSVNKRVAISDISLLCKLSVLLLLDLIYFVLKLFVDPFFVDEDTVSIEFEPKGNGKTKMHWKTYSCESEKSYPEYILAVVKTLLVIFGVFLSFETRSVHIDELNDSRTIAVSIYNAVVCFVFGAFTTYASGEFQPTMNFVLQSAVVLYCVAFLVGTHFLPRQIKVLRYPSVANDVNIRKTSPNSHVTTTMTMNKKLDYE